MALLRLFRLLPSSHLGLHPLLLTRSTSLLQRAHPPHTPPPLLVSPIRNNTTLSPLITPLIGRIWARFALLPHPLPSPLLTPPGRRVLPPPLLGNLLGRAVISFPLLTRSAPPLDLLTPPPPPLLPPSLRRALDGPRLFSRLGRSGPRLRAERPRGGGAHLSPPARESTAHLPLNHDPSLSPSAHLLLPQFSWACLHES